MRRVRKNLPKILLHLLGSVATFLVLCLSVSAQDEESSSTARTGTLSGRVISESGQPISHAAIYVGAPMSPMQSRMSSTDDNGNFQIEGLDLEVAIVVCRAHARLHRTHWRADINRSMRNRLSAFTYDAPAERACPRCAAAFLILGGNRKAQH